MKIIMLGAPGAGKGTQAVRIAAKLGVPHISTGDIFRKNIREQTPLGLSVKDCLDSGKLVPDELTIAIVRDRLSQADCAQGYVLDGFPRTVAQAEALETFATIDRVVNLETRFDELVTRLSGRRVCPCGQTYHISTHPSPTCDQCGGTLYQRDDDTAETVAQRLTVYTRETKPLIDFYAHKSLLTDVDGMQSIDQVTSDVLKAL